MSDVLSHLNNELGLWAQQAHQQGWISAQSVRALDNTTTTTPGALFDKPGRPLVVGFFGGTGVGKSTLLNRLAGEQIARTSVERPTSRDITLYLHQSVNIAQLPKEFPMQRMLTSTHQNNEYRSVMWIDMPDFDSVEASHRELVDHWLPHIDIVVYVVSPERYRDDHGWRLLLEHGHKHAWLFVMNHWDRGDEQQRSDFKNLLGQAGLSDPLIYCTDCSDTNTNDDFNQFRETIHQVADQQLIAQLESRGIVARFKQMRQLSDQMRNELALEQNLEQFSSNWPAQAKTLSEDLLQSSEWKIPALAEQYAEKDNRLFSGLLSRFSSPKQLVNNPESAIAQVAVKSAIENATALDTTDNAKAISPTALPALNDEAFYDRLDEHVTEFVQSAVDAEIPLKAVQAHVEPAFEKGKKAIANTLDTEIQKSLAQPGTALERFAYKSASTLSWLLPVAAMGWVGYRLVNVFRLGAHDPAAYLSSNFAVHSALLVGLAWLVPTFLSYKLKPSRVQAAARGLKNGVLAAAELVDASVRKGLENVKADHQLQLQSLDKVLDNAVEFDDKQLPEAVRRMLIADQP